MASGIQTLCRQAPLQVPVSEFGNPRKGDLHAGDPAKTVGVTLEVPKGKRAVVALYASLEFQSYVWPAPQVQPGLGLVCEVTDSGGQTVRPYAEAEPNPLPIALGLSTPTLRFIAPPGTRVRWFARVTDDTLVGVSLKGVLLHARAVLLDDKAMDEELLPLVGGAL